MTDVERDLPDGVLAVRAGPGANCSSIGSVVDLLFVASVGVGVAYAALAVALGDPPAPAPSPSREPHESPEKEAER